MDNFYPKRSHFWGALGATLAFLFPYLKHLVHPLCPIEDNSKNAGKIAIVTGANGNLGFPLSLHLVKRQYRVIMACRDMELCKVRRREIVLRTGYKNVACRYLDLEDVDSINEFVSNFKKTEGRLDVLVNNAAVKDEPNKTLTKYGIERNYFVNFLAPFLLTMMLMDKLEETSKITKTSSVINVIGSPKKNWLRALDLDDINFETRPYSAKEAYNQSKLALAYFTILLEKHCADKGRHVYVYGWNPVFKKFRKSLPYYPQHMFEGMVFYLKNWVLSEPERASHTMLMLANNDDVKNRLKSGKLYSFVFHSFGWGVASQSELAAKGVWNHGLELLSNLKTDPPASIATANSGDQDSTTANTEPSDSIIQPKIAPE